MAQMRAHAHPHLGRLVQPRHYTRLADMLADGIPWAADNDCFQGLDPTAYSDMLDALQQARIDHAGGDRRAETWTDRCLFVTVPDVVADAKATVRGWVRWSEGVRRRGLPVGFVLQDGCERGGLVPPWHLLDAVFIGGSTEWKLGAAAEWIVGEARARRKWVHMGRVNSARRISYAKAIGVDSIDGTSYVKWRDRYLDAGLTAVAEPLGVVDVPFDGMLRELVVGTAY
jgi:hypothetical protein